MREGTTRRSLLRAIAAAPLTTSVAGVGRASQADSSADTFDPNVHGFGFPNWSTAVPTFPEHDHDAVTETQIRRTIRREWHDPFERLLSIDFDGLPDVLLDAVAKQLYVSVNQLSGTNGHCYGMVFAAQQYFERPETIPVERSTASEIQNPSEPLGDPSAPVGEEIDLYHITQYLSPHAWIGRRQLNSPATIDYRRQVADLLAVLDEHGSAGITLFEAGARQSHQVLVYDYQQADDGVRLFVYDPNRRAGRYGGDAGFVTADVDFDAETPVNYSLNPTYGHFVYNRRDRILAARSGSETAVERQLDEFDDDLFRVGLFLLDSEDASLHVIDPDRKRVGRDTADFQDRERSDYHAMRYRYGVDPGRYRLAVTAKRATEYTLEVRAADLSGELAWESVSKSIGAGETHEYVATIPESANEAGTLERVGTGVPQWLLVLGGTGAVAAGAAGYRRFRSPSRECD